MCSLVCSVFYWLIGNALLIYCVVVNLRLHIPWFNVCCRFGVVELEWYPRCRLKHNWSVHVGCGGWGLMTVWNRGFISPGLYSGMSLPSR